MEFQDESLDISPDYDQDPALNYSIILSEYHQTYLSTLSYDSEHGVFVSFDSDSTHCIVDN